MALQKNVMWLIYILYIIDIEKQHGNIYFNLNCYAQSLFVRTIILVCDLCSVTLLIRKICPFVTCTLKEIKRSRNCTWEWNEKMLSAAKQRRRADLPRRIRELARDQRNESALAEKGAEGMFLYFFLCKSMTYGWVKNATTWGTVVAPWTFGTSSGAPIN